MRHDLLPRVGSIDVRGDRALNQQCEAVAIEQYHRVVSKKSGRSVGLGLRRLCLFRFRGRRGRGDLLHQGAPLPRLLLAEPCERCLEAGVIRARAGSTKPPATPSGGVARGGGNSPPTHFIENVGKRALKSRDAADEGYKGSK